MGFAKDQISNYDSGEMWKVVSRKCKAHNVEGELRVHRTNPLSIKEDYMLSNQYWPE